MTVLSRFLIVTLTALAVAVPVSLAGTSKGTTVDVTLKAGHIKLSRYKAPPGRVRLHIKNESKVKHSVIVIQTNRAQDKLPMKGNKVDLKKAGTVRGMIPVIKGGNDGAIVMQLGKGKYVVICNMPGHYKAGEHTAFAVS
jgi:uncharacterized cupredoxin-like copper-binding protein